MKGEKRIEPTPMPIKTYGSGSGLGLGFAFKVGSAATLGGAASRDFLCASLAGSAGARRRRSARRATAEVL